MTDSPPPSPQHDVPANLAPAYREIQMAFRRFADARDSAPIADLVNKFSIELFRELRIKDFINDLHEHNLQMARRLTWRSHDMLDQAIIPEFRLGFQKAVEMMTGYLAGERL